MNHTSASPTDRQPGRDIENWIDGNKLTASQYHAWSEELRAVGYKPAYSMMSTGQITCPMCGFNHIALISWTRGSGRTEEFQDFNICLVCGSATEQKPVYAQTSPTEQPGSTTTDPNKHCLCHYCKTEMIYRDTIGLDEYGRHIELWYCPACDFAYKGHVQPGLEYDPDLEF